MAFSKISRREAAKRLGSAAAALALSPDVLARAKSSSLDPEPLTIAGQAVELRLTEASARTLRITLLPVSSSGVTGLLPESDVLAQRSWPAPFLKTRSIGSPQKFTWGSHPLTVFANPLSLVVESQAGIPIQHLQIDSRDGTVSFLSGGRPIFGLGEGGRQFDRRGSAYPMRHGERVPDLATDGARMPVPWIIGASGWAAFFHLPAGTFDLSRDPGTFRPQSPPLPLDFFLVIGNPETILAEYARLTGLPHMPPAWALGYQQSHRTLSNREEVIGEADEFRRKNLPCDVLIYLGTGFCPSGWNMGHGSYTFNPRVFPDPAAMISELHRQHFKVVLHEDKPPQRLTGKMGSPGSASPYNVNSYWKEHLPVFDLGVDGWWADEGDWLTNDECLLRNRMYWEGSLAARPNVRPYTLNRNGYAGLQRYGWLWSGDTKSTWQTLRDQIAVGLNTGLSGIPYWGSDTGGFAPSPELTGELYARWFEFSAFCPLFRSHGRTWKLRLPWGWDTGSYGPIESPQTSLPPLSALHDARVEPICRKYLDLRSRLLPYLYTAIRAAHDTGMPVMRALWLSDPDDASAVERDDEYMWGPSLLIAPVLEPGATSRALYLPRGSWYDFWTNERVEGGREITRAVDLATLPIYARAGAVIPLSPISQFTSEEPRRPMTLLIFPGASAEAELYEDDGVSLGFSRGEFSRCRFEWDGDNRELRITQAPGGHRGGYSTRTFEARIATESKTHSLQFQGKPVTIRL